MLLSRFLASGSFRFVSHKTQDDKGGGARAGERGEGPPNKRETEHVRKAKDKNMERITIQFTIQKIVQKAETSLTVSDVTVSTSSLLPCAAGTLSQRQRSPPAGWEQIQLRAACRFGLPGKSMNTTKLRIVRAGGSVQ